MQLPFKVNARAPSLRGTVHVRTYVQLADGDEQGQGGRHRIQRKQKAE